MDLRRSRHMALLVAVPLACLLACATGGTLDPPAAEEPAVVEEPAALADAGPAPGEQAAPPEVPPGEEILLRPGEEAAVEGTGGVLSFARMISDSRCPRDTLCVWAGEVTLLLEWTVGGAEAEALRVAGFPPVAAATESGHTVTVVQVDPYPEQGRKFDPSAYRATLKVTEADQGQGEGEASRSVPSDSKP
jgi:hypothetical protein